MRSTGAYPDQQMIGIRSKTSAPFSFIEIVCETTVNRYSGMTMVSAPALFAAVSYLVFSVGGMLAQVVKVVRRRRSKERGELSELASQSMEPLRYFVIFLAFYLFTAIGLSRSYFDHVLVWTRTPAIFLTWIVLFYIYREQKVFRAKLSFFLSCFLLAILALILCVTPFIGRAYLRILAVHIDTITLALAVLVVGMNLLQAFRIWQSERTGGVSWVRDAGTITKDALGIWYSWYVGAELLSAAIMHCASILSLLVVVGTYRSVALKHRRVRNEEAPDT